MSLKRIEPGASIDVERGDLALVMVLGAPTEMQMRSLQSVARTTDQEIPLLLCLAGASEPKLMDLLEQLSFADDQERQWLLLEAERTDQLTETLNRAINVCVPADVVLLTSACLVGEGWLDLLRAAARSDDRVASVSALSDGSGPLSLPDGPPAIPDAGGLDERAFADTADKLRGLAPMRPWILSAEPPCIYLCRSALELCHPAPQLGPFDPALRVQPAIVDFSQRCVLHGLVHLGADDVFVHDPGARGGVDFGGEVEGGGLLADRFRYLPNARAGMERETAGSLPHALAAAQIAARDPSVTIDARALTSGVNGTKLHIVELIGALAKTGRARVRALVTADLGEFRQPLTAIDGLELLYIDEIDQATLIDDVIHRPYQVSSLGELDLLSALGRSVLITQQDLIGFRNPAYFPANYWAQYRRVARTAAGFADRVLFFSEHAKRDALKEGLVDEGRAVVVPIGIDHQVMEPAAKSGIPLGAEGLQGAEFMLCLGSDFAHKNRVFAIELLRALREDHGWDGKLALAGLTVEFGSSRPLEEELLEFHPELRDAVFELGCVDEAGKAWLLGNATAVIYPTTVEGFGLLPFEAAGAGVPCLFASGTSLAETLPVELGCLVPWSAKESAERAIGLLRDDRLRSEHVRITNEAGSRFRWSDTAEQLLNVYREAACPPGPAAQVPTDAVAHRPCPAAVAPGQALAVDILNLEHELAQLRAQRESACSQSELAQTENAVLREAVAERDARLDCLDADALGLVGPGGQIPKELHRPLLAVTTRSYLRRPFFAALKAGYSLTKRLGGS